MEIGIIGLPQAGKTTVFNLLTGNAAITGSGQKGRASLGMAEVGDSRIDYLAGIYVPKKVVHAQIAFTDATCMKQENNSAQTRDTMLASQNVDALVQVVRVFSSAVVPHHWGEINAVRDLELLQTELLLADLQLVETRITRLETSNNKRQQNREIDLAVLQKCRMYLEAERPLGQVEFDRAETALLRQYVFYTAKPTLLVVNLDESAFVRGEYGGKRELHQWAKDHGMPIIPICGQLEMEINELPVDERGAFLTNLGLEEPGIQRLARAAYRLLNLVSYFTVGHDEVRAWTIKAGTVAREAAGKIHSDIARGFIRAEVVSYSDFCVAGGMAGAREKGLCRLEGKEYVVQDGDIVNFRFNV